LDEDLVPTLWEGVVMLFSLQQKHYNNGFWWFKMLLGGGFGVCHIIIFNLLKGT
jgi:hypothetical protein